MKRLISLLILCASIQASFSAEERLYNTNSQKSVLDLATAPDLKPWERLTTLEELCFKGDPQAAHAELLFFEQEEILFNPDTEAYIDSEALVASIKVISLNGKMMDDGLTEEEAQQLQLK